MTRDERHRLRSKGSRLMSDMRKKEKPASKSHKLKAFGKKLVQVYSILV